MNNLAKILWLIFVVLFHVVGTYIGVKYGRGGVIRYAVISLFVLLILTSLINHFNKK